VRDREKKKLKKGLGVWGGPKVSKQTYSCETTQQPGGLVQDIAVETNFPKEYVWRTEKLKRTKKKKHQKEERERNEKRTINFMKSREKKTQGKEDLGRVLGKAGRGGR